MVRTGREQSMAQSGVRQQAETLCQTAPDSLGAASTNMLRKARGCLRWINLLKRRAGRRAAERRAERTAALDLVR